MNLPFVKCQDCMSEMVSSLMLDDHQATVVGYECVRCEHRITKDEVDSLLSGFSVIDPNPLDHRS